MCLPLIMTMKQARSLNKRFKAKIDANVELLVWLSEDQDGEQEVEEVLELISEVKEFDNVRED